MSHLHGRGNFQESSVLPVLEGDDQEWVDVVVEHGDALGGEWEVGDVVWWSGGAQRTGAGPAARGDPMAAGTSRSGSGGAEEGFDSASPNKPECAGLQVTMEKAKTTVGKSSRILQNKIPKELKMNLLYKNCTYILTWHGRV